MNINTIFVTGFIGLIGYIVYKSLKTPTSMKPERFGLLVAQDTGKSKINQSKTGDISLVIERIRRRAIQQHGITHKSKIKETHTQKGSSTGAMETFMLTGISPFISKCDTYDIIFDGGNENANYCEYDGDGYLDAGNDVTKACGV